MTQLQEIPWREEVKLQVTAETPVDRAQLPTRRDLFQIPWLRWLITNRWPQFLVRTITLSGFIFTIATGQTGPKVGSHNFAIIMIWIAWWTALKLAFIPLGGRSWCSVCPIPLPGDWLQQGGILQRGKHPVGLGLRWPKKLTGSWLQSAGFLLIGMFSAVTLTTPQVTSWVLIGLFVLAAGLSLVFERRAFCSHLCPVGGFSGMYAKAAPVELRVKDTATCASHVVKSCYQACPWGLYPLSFRDSSACGLCMECVRACPSDNLRLNIRQFGADLGKARTTSRVDEALLALVMLGSVMTFTAVFTGPWGWLKSAAFAIGSPAWVGYVAGYLGLTLVLLPAMFAALIWIGMKVNQGKVPFKRALANQSQALIPLGLTAWIAFTVSFAFPKMNLVLGVLNDPLGWGWHLLGGTARNVQVAGIGYISIIQVVLLLLGLFWSIRTSQRCSSAGYTHGRINFPVVAFSLSFTLAMLWLLIG